MFRPTTNPIKILANKILTLPQLGERLKIATSIAQIQAELKQYSAQQLNAPFDTNETIAKTIIEVYTDIIRSKQTVESAPDVLNLLESYCAQGGKLDYKDELNGNSLLHYAITIPKQEVNAYFVNLRNLFSFFKHKGFDFTNCKNKKSQNLLVYAARHRNYPIIKTLNILGSELDQPDDGTSLGAKIGQTVLDVLLESGDSTADAAIAHVRHYHGKRGQELSSFYDETPAESKTIIDDDLNNKYSFLASLYNPDHTESQSHSFLLRWVEITYKGDTLFDTDQQAVDLEFVESLGQIQLTRLFSSFIVKYNSQAISAPKEEVYTPVAAKLMMEAKENQKLTREHLANLELSELVDTSELENYISQMELDDFVEWFDTSKLNTNEWEFVLKKTKSWSDQMYLKFLTLCEKYKELYLKNSAGMHMPAFPIELLNELGKASQSKIELKPNAIEEDKSSDQEIFTKVVAVCKRDNYDEFEQLALRLTAKEWQMISDKLNTNSKVKSDTCLIFLNYCLDYRDRNPATLQSTSLTLALDKYWNETITAVKLNCLSSKPEAKSKYKETTKLFSVATESRLVRTAIKWTKPTRDRLTLFCQPEKPVTTPAAITNKAPEPM
ncbi:MAG: hypothetical protein ABI597_03200 [Gammaproteobacteria bacterium]